VVCARVSRAHQRRGRGDWEAARRDGAAARVREIVGNSAIDLTMTIYAHASLDEKRRALDRLGDRLAEQLQLENYRAPCRALIGPGPPVAVGAAVK
jgi:hypothetical protein